MDTQIVIQKPGAAYNRFLVADQIQDACNPIAVARELVRVIHAASNDPTCNGTDYLRSDAAIVAVIDKLRSLMRKDAADALWECMQKSK
jgi:hypothetical protein